VLKLSQILWLAASSLLIAAVVAEHQEDKTERARTMWTTATDTPQVSENNDTQSG
jgi:hypothetical protein